MSEAGLLESEWVEKQLGRPVVKAFNSITHNSLEHLGKPVGSSDRIALPLAGDRVEDKKKVAKLIADLGFDALDSGPLSESWRQQPGVVGLFTTFSDDTLDVERFALVRSLKPLTCEGNFSRLRAKPAHFVGHLPADAEARAARADTNRGTDPIKCA